ncbi:hypothetical protein GCM10010978_12670 [Compostibacillus humi]|uniref:Sin domain-containing protein n=1 Tax=Compostibacillus humi TaxID=1245525 RepID=A0A8J2ZRB3_9BACI|nr:anti-repressor SinI family protein [Compostibacillus humi]GGH74122.1 hypothetical protein GCM10010978_12670 [Compostibacillus humi]HLT56760.1 anti-repressor SinI family protein [Bacillota bacterium]
MKDLVEKKGLDMDWVLLIKEAKSLGMTVEEIRRFIEKAKQKT